MSEAATMPTVDLIADVCDQIKLTLIEKNRAYGDSAIDPVRIFSSADTREQLLVRIDDKLSRIARGGELGEDVVLDLIGYLVLLRVHDQQPVNPTTMPPTGHRFLTSSPTNPIPVTPEEDEAFEAEKADMLGRLQSHEIDVEQVRPPGRDLRRSED